MSEAAQRAAREADWLTIGDADGRILRSIAPLDVETVSLADAEGLVLAEPITSPIDHPAWDNSAMDGFAARARDVAGASAQTPVLLNVVESIPAGAFPTRRIEAGQAAAITTGAPLPEGADSVIRVEHTRTEVDGRVAVLDSSDAGRNVRFEGEDIRRGATVLNAGRVVRPAEIGVLSTVGRVRVAVHRRPRVALLSTGDELVNLDEYDRVASGRSVLNSNGYALAAAVRATGGLAVPLGIARDDADSLRERLTAGSDADVLITTAGASVGEHDLVKDVLEAMGMRLHFWRVRIRPGSPSSFGTIERAHKPALPVFGLPGNPVSALVTFEVLVRPALRRLLGHSRLYSRTVMVRAAEPMPARGNLTHFLRVILDESGDQPLAHLTGPQGSGVLTSMTSADALLVVPAGSGGLPAGAEAVALRLDVAEHTQGERGYD